jgi:tRNA-2-methylthio-N6-dimethylallyladenosine synthase
MRYFIKTFGCQMNVSDSERIAGFLEMQPHPNPLLAKERGFVLTKNMNRADLVIFNTCGVRQSAEDRVYGQIHNLRKKSASRRTKIKIILTGCLSNRKDVQRRLKNKVDLFFPINDFQKFENWIIENCLKIENCKLKISAQRNKLSQENIAYLSINPKYTNNYQAFVPIMTGCNNFCSYCVVPYARGPEVSRLAKEIISEVRALVEKGCKEIILLGQNVNSYKERNTNFSKLLKKVNAIPGDFWVFFVSNHPKDFSEELIETAIKLKKVCEIIHLPIQAGDNKILQKMNRKYTVEEYLLLINKIRKAFKKYKPEKIYAVTSDIIVGFPGETRKQFMGSAKIMKKVDYDMVYFGQFSPRPGTVAWKMKDNVFKREKEKRETFLNEILKKTALKNNKKYLGKSIKVLITEKKEAYYFGHTRTMKNVRIISGRKNLVGKIAEVKITKANAWNLEGTY